MTGAWFNVPGAGGAARAHWVLVRDDQGERRNQQLMVGIKLLAILIFVFGASSAVQPSNWQPFMPNGFPGVLTGARAGVFHLHRLRFGFDGGRKSASVRSAICPSVSSRAGVCTVHYIAVWPWLLTGIGDYRQMNNAAPVVNALHALGYINIRRWVGAGAVVGNAQFPTGLPVRAGAGVVRHVARRAAAEAFFQGASAAPDPYVCTWIAGLAVGIPAGIWDIGTSRICPT